MSPKKTAWARYVENASLGERDSQIAERAGVSQSTVSRWKTGSLRPDAAKVIDFARTYGLNPIGALIASGYIDKSEMDELRDTHDSDLVDFNMLDAFTVEQLLDEVRLRIDELRRERTEFAHRLPLIELSSVRDLEELPHAALHDPELDQDEDFH